MDVKQTIGNKSSGHRCTHARNPKQRLQETLSGRHEEHPQGDLDGGDNRSFDHSQKEAQSDEVAVRTGGAV